MNEQFHKRLREAMLIRDMQQVDLVEKTGIAKSAISAYVNGEYLPKQINTHKIAQALRVDEGWLMGKDVDMEPLPPNVVPLNLYKVPILGSISGGEPIFVEEQRGSFVLLNGDNDVDFCLRVKGDSMRDARICNGDLVFVRKQSYVDNGEIAVVLIDSEATLKRFYKTENGVILKPENPNYQPLFYNQRDFKDVRILGKAILVQSKISEVLKSEATQWLWECVQAIR